MPDNPTVRDRDAELDPRPADLTDRQWRQLVPLLPAQRRRQGQLPRDLRQMIHAGRAPVSRRIPRP